MSTTVARLKEMFERLVVAKDPTAIADFYAPSFVMDSNGVQQDFATFAGSHERVYATEIVYAVDYDEAAWVEGNGNVAGRVWITTERPDEAATRFEVVLIAHFDDDGRITRVWETTWPDWSQTRAFEAYAQSWGEDELAEAPGDWRLGLALGDAL
jgi:hypothetical protein